MLALCIAVLGVGPASAVAIAGNGHGGGGGNPPIGSGQHGQDCAPGYHDTSAGPCEHNGAGGGNCGDNQSGNNNGLGNNGNDNGFGHKGDTCDPPAPPRPPGPPGPPAPPGPPTPPNNPGSPVTPNAPGHPSAPSLACAGSLSLGRTHFTVGRRTLLAVRVKDAGGRAVRKILVLVRGAGVRLSSLTNEAGKARFVIRALNAGAIRITVRQSAKCSSVSGLVLASAAKKAHKPDFTG